MCHILSSSSAPHKLFHCTGKQEGVTITLDSAYGEFLTDDRVVISLKGGELYVLTLVADSMRSVRSFHFDKAAASVLTCTVCSSIQNLFMLCHYIRFLVYIIFSHGVYYKQEDGTVPETVFYKPIGVHLVSLFGRINNYQ